MSSPVKLTTRLPAPSLIASIDSISVHQYLTIRKGKGSNRSFEIPNRYALNNYISIIFSTIYASTIKDQSPITASDKNILQTFPFIFTCRGNFAEKAKIPRVKRSMEGEGGGGGDRGLAISSPTGRKNGRTFPKEGSSTQVVGVQRMLDPPAARFFFFFFFVGRAEYKRKGVRARGLIFE